MRRTGSIVRIVGRTSVSRVSQTGGIASRQNLERRGRKQTSLCVRGRKNYLQAEQVFRPGKFLVSRRKAKRQPSIGVRLVTTVTTLLKPNR